jgi:poly(beta-D-mannuronate) C5 epimerase
MNDLFAFVAVPFLLRAFTFSGILATITVSIAPTNIYAQSMDRPGSSQSHDGLADNPPESTPLVINGSAPSSGGNFSIPLEPQTEPQTGNNSSGQSRVMNPEPMSIHSTDPCIGYEEESHVVEINCNADIYQLFIGLRDDSITEQLGSGEILIKSNITVAKDATFDINSDKGINYVKIAAGNGIKVFGKINIDDTKITSWDPANGTVIDQNAAGDIPRAYLFLSGSQGGRIHNSELAYMGYNETGYRGIDLLANSSSLHIMNSTFDHLWYGFFSNGAYNITIASSVYRNNEEYAIDPHTGTHNMTITNNTIYNNPIGLVCSLDCYDIVYEHNQIYNNSGAGIFFSRNTHDSIARYNTIYKQPVGIALSESPDNEVYGNEISLVGRGIFLSDPTNLDDGSTTNNRIYNNTITKSAVGIAAFRTHQNVAFDNHFYNITVSQYRLNANSTLTITNQSFDNTMIVGQVGQNILTIANSSNIQINDASSIDTSVAKTIMLSNQTATLSNVALREQP